MIKSLYRSATRLFVAWALAGLTGFVFACESDSDPAFCEDAPPPVFDLPVGLSEGVDFKAELVVEERWQTDADGGVTVSGLVGAYFADLTEFEEALIPAIPFGLACVGEVGRHVIARGPDPVNTGALALLGLVPGEVILEKSDAGLFETRLFRENIFAEGGGEAIRVQVTTAGQGDGFPAFDLTAVVPPAVQAGEIALLTDGSIEVDWVGADAGYFEVVLTTAAPEPGLPSNRLRCLLADDGCHRVPAGGLAWLLSQGVREITVRFKRHDLVHSAIEKGVLAELDVTRSLEFKLKID